MQPDARSKLTGAESRLSLLQDFEDPRTAWVAQGAMERHILLGSCLARRPCHNRIVPTPSV
jgi:hypothetical protein